MVTATYKMHAFMHLLDFLSFFLFLPMFFAQNNDLKNVLACHSPGLAPKKVKIFCKEPIPNK